jgi:AcrR family transcriptional regulator
MARKTLRPVAVKSYHHGNLHATLLNVAGSLLAKRGAAGLTLRDIAKAAKVSHAAPYHHFASREELLAALAERAFAALAAAMQRAANVSEPRARLVAICESYVAFGREAPAVFRLMFGPMLAQRRRYPGMRRAAERAFAILLKAAMDYDPGEGRLLALTGWSLAHGLANLAIDGAFDALPIPVADPAKLGRRMAERMLARTASSAK